MRTRFVLAAVVVGSALAGAAYFNKPGAAEPAWAGQTGGKTKQPPANDEAGLKKALAGYLEAFNKGDLKGLMAHFAADPEFVDETGAATRGRDAISGLFKKTFEEHKGTKMKIALRSTRFLKPDVAVQTGVVTLTAPDGFADQGAYSAIWVKADGKWALARVQDLPGDADAAAGTNFDMLKQLDWLVGEWHSESKDASVDLKCKWTKSQNFMMIEQTIHLKDQEAMVLTTILGWDPLLQQIRSWVFDSGGGFGEGLWARNGNRWVVESAGVLSDGRTASATSVWRFIDEGHFEWESTDREIDGRPVADVGAKYVRKGAKK